MNHLHQRDLQKLSAYLDQELSRREIKKLELRLQAEPALRAALRELEGTKILLAKMPRVSPPHNFTLTRAMAGEIKSRGFYPFFRVASVIATVAFAVLVGADAFLLDQAGSYRFAAPLAAIGVSEEVESEAQFFDAPAADELLGEADAVAEAPAEQALGAAEDRVFATPTGLQALEGDAGFAAGTETLDAAQTPCRECPSAMERAAVSPTGTVLGAGETTPGVQTTVPPSVLPPAADLEKAEETIIAPSATTQLPSPTMAPTTTIALEKPNNLLRIAEVVSGLAALLFVVGALILRRTH